MNNTLKNAYPSIKVLHQKDERLHESIRESGCCFLVDCFCVNDSLDLDMDVEKINAFFIMARTRGSVRSDGYINDHDDLLADYINFRGYETDIGAQYCLNGEAPFIWKNRTSRLKPYAICEMSGNGVIQHFITAMYDPMHGDTVCDQIESIRTIYISFYDEEE